DGIRDRNVTGVQTCALPISFHPRRPWCSGTGRRGVLRHDAAIVPQEAARAARSDARRRQILGAAVPLMERSGSPAVSMQAIADEAGVSVGLIYRYFASKQEL